MDNKSNQKRLDPQLEDAMKLFAQTYTPVYEIAHADSIKSMHEMKNWFLERDLEISGSAICEELKKHGFEMIYTGGMYLFLLKNK